MNIGQINHGIPLPLRPDGARAAQPQGQSFGGLVADAVGQLNALQHEADTAAIEVATGQSADLHSALVTIEEASLALELAIQVRNKVVEAYQEVMRMQV